MGIINLNNIFLVYQCITNVIIYTYKTRQNYCSGREMARQVKILAEGLMT